MQDFTDADRGLEPATARGRDVFGRAEFPNVARLELDELLEQLITRAGEVQRTQGRLRGLLRAFLTVAKAHDLDDLLRQVVSAARQLVSAEYAALGVIRDGRLVRFVHEGMDPATVAQIGALPQGKGLLGRLVEQPEPLRLTDIAADPCAVGFPANHPPMTSFLGVPIQVGDRIFGNLYLTNKQGRAQFSTDDQELLQALATAAGLAIDNAQLLGQVRRGQDWQTALVETTTGLLSGANPEMALRDLVHHALLSAGAAGAGVLVPVDDQTLRMTVVEGAYESSHHAAVPIEGSIAGAAWTAGHAVHLVDPTADARITETVVDVLSMTGPTIAAPIPSAIGLLGVLCVSRAPGSEPFDDADERLIGAYASRAGLALQLADARRDTEDLHLVEDRSQIAEQLRERVISRLYGAGLSVQALLPRVTNIAVRKALAKHIDEIDATIADMRHILFAISAPTPDSRPSPSTSR